MSDTFTNATGCEVSQSHITGDIVCQRPGPDCDCLIVAKPSCSEHGTRYMAVYDDGSSLCGRCYMDRARDLGVI